VVRNSLPSLPSPYPSARDAHPSKPKTGLPGAPVCAPRERSWARICRAYGPRSTVRRRCCHSRQHSRRFLMRSRTCTDAKPIYARLRSSAISRPNFFAIFASFAVSDARRFALSPNEARQGKVEDMKAPLICADCGHTLNSVDYQIWGTKRGFVQVRNVANMRKTSGRVIQTCNSLVQLFSETGCRSRFSDSGGVLRNLALTPEASSALFSPLRSFDNPNVSGFWAH
jgi:hypothetical protein